jgi:hypothetical protein
MSSLYADGKIQRHLDMHFPIVRPIHLRESAMTAFVFPGFGAADVEITFKEFFSAKLHELNHGR